MISVLRFNITSDKKEKFHYCCKLMHELAANIFESYKQLDRRYNLQISHLFKIIKLDYNCEEMDLLN
jgi:hypothetical protein